MYRTRALVAGSVLLLATATAACSDDDGLDDAAITDRCDDYRDFSADIDDELREIGDRFDASAAGGDFDPDDAADFLGLVVDNGEEALDFLDDVETWTGADDDFQELVDEARERSEDTLADLEDEIERIEDDDDYTLADLTEFVNNAGPEDGDGLLTEVRTALGDEDVECERE